MRFLPLFLALPLAACAAPLHTAIAQVQPERLYYGVNRPIPMTVVIPADAKGGEAEIRLLKPVSAEEAAKASVVAGKVDLAALFPILWTSKAPEKPADKGPELFYAQLFVGGKKVGPAVVLQPMVKSPRAQLDQRNPNQPQVVFDTDPPAGAAYSYYSGIKAYVDKHVLLETTRGDIEIALRPDVAPNTAWFFREFVDGGFYTDTTFHRIIASGRGGKGFVVQGGDPTMADGGDPKKADGGPGFEYDLEKSSLPHDFGVISMARDADPNTNGSQFFICLTREETARLDGLYCAFAQAVSGAEVITKLGQTPMAAGSKDTPIKPPRIKTARLIDAPPYGEGPKPVAQQAANPPGR